MLVLFSGELSVANISALSSPEFYIPNLEPAQEYDASIYSFNSKGLYEFIFFAMLFSCARFSIVTALLAGTYRNWRSTGKECNSISACMFKLLPFKNALWIIYLWNIDTLWSTGSSKYTSPIRLKTLPAPGLKELRRSTEPTENTKLTLSGPWFYILLAAGSTLIVAAAVGLIVFAVRRFKVRIKLYQNILNLTEYLF